MKIAVIGGAGLIGSNIAAKLRGHGHGHESGPAASIRCWNSSVPPRPRHTGARVNGFGPDTAGGTRAGFSGSATIDRNDFGVDIKLPLDGGGVVVGDKVQVTLEIEAVLRQA